MKYIKQLVIILGISFVGEIMHHFLPFPVPASIYGLCILLVLLLLGKVKPVQIKETSNFLLEMMPVMFVPAAAGLIPKWNIIKPILVPALFITLVSTVVIMAVTGRVTQLCLRLFGKGGKKNA